MTKSIEGVLQESLLQAAEDGGTTVNGLVTIRLEALKEIEALIRTEKLKLLTSVRERVVGEEDFYDSNERTLLRNQQFEELIKLEAEL